MPRQILLIFLLIFTVLFLCPSAAQAAEPVDCVRVIEQLKAEPDWLEKLADPVIHSDYEYSQRYEFYRLVYECLSLEPETLGEDLQAVRLLTAYFLTFLDMAPDTEHNSVLWVVDPASFPDPALERLRSEVGLAPPQGSFYLRLYPSRLELPQAVQSIFDNQNAFGVTILTRYLAVVIINSLGWNQDQSIDAETLGTISHELVHAFVNASVGASRAVDLPDWYQEGLALYFSHSKDYVYQGTGSSFVRQAPEDYQGYLENMRFLEKKLGKEGLNEAVRKSVENADPSELYAGLGIASEEEFFAQVAEWRQAGMRRSRWSAFIFIGIPLLVLAAMLLAARFWREKVACPNCGREWKKNELRYGHCPACKTRVLAKERAFPYR
jgi:DNA-directed RNA polymerase subunit RPC12/RpoP